MFKSILLGSSLIAAVSAQGAGSLTAETHPALPIKKCTSSSCTTENTKITLDSNWRWTHSKQGYTNCYTGNSWDKTLCPDGKTCAANCVLEGADYPGTYGISASGNSLNLKFVTKSQGTNVGSRVYLMENDSSYKMFSLLNQEFTIDVDVSKLPCGLNGALYFVEMDKDGGMAKNPGNTAGAKYGTGYCDTQCPHDMKFISGEANVDGWTPSATDPNGGTGKYGACCPEMDIWEANKVSTAYTPHTCKSQGLVRCANAADCGDGDQRYSSICDKDGCDFNSYRMGNTSFYGPGKIVDTTKPFSIVTQFIGNPLTEIRRKYVQNGKVIDNSVSNIAGVSGNSITNKFCDAQKKAFGDNTAYQKLGGTAGMGKSIGSGMVLALSIWGDHFAHMLWLDSTYPTDKVGVPGAARGDCPVTSGDPKDLEANSPDASVTFSNIRYGPIGSTFK